MTHQELIERWRKEAAGWEDDSFVPNRVVATVLRACALQLESIEQAKRISDLKAENYKHALGKSDHT